MNKISNQQQAGGIGRWQKNGWVVLADDKQCFGVTGNIPVVCPERFENWIL